MILFGSSSPRYPAGLPANPVRGVGPVPDEYPPCEINELTTRYSTSTTRLLKCDLCGTYYYYNHYENEGEFFMDPPSNTLALRRYDPMTAKDFLERLLYGSENVLPNALGQLIKAFADGNSDLTTRVAQEGLSAKLALARVIALYYLAVLSSHGVDLVGANPGMGWAVTELAVYQPVQLGEFIFLGFDQ